MTDARLIELCEFIIATDADKEMLSSLHVKPDGAIAITLMKALDAIIHEEDFDFRTFIAELINYVEGDEKPKLLN